MPRLRNLPPLLNPLPPLIPKQPKRAEHHYGTAEHRAWSNAVRTRAGWKCEDPEHDPPLPRSGVRLHADHIVERQDGGAPFDVTNGMCRCTPCHGRKTAAERARRLGP